MLDGMASPRTARLVHNPLPGLMGMNAGRPVGRGMAQSGAMTFETYFNVHLVSDSTGETLNAVMRAAAAQFDNIAPLEQSYYLVRSQKQLERVLKEIENAPGVVLYTITDEGLRSRLE